MLKLLQSTAGRATVSKPGREPFSRASTGCLARDRRDADAATRPVPTLRSPGCPIISWRRRSTATSFNVLKGPLYEVTAPYHVFFSLLARGARYIAYFLRLRARFTVFHPSNLVFAFCYPRQHCCNWFSTDFRWSRRRLFRRWAVASTCKN